MSKVKHCGKLLMKWDEDTFKRTQWRIAWLKRCMGKLRQMGQTRVIIEESREVERELRELRRIEETAAWQRSRPFVLRDGDKNTTFFHAKASSRLKRNNLNMLHDKDGNPQTTLDAMKKVVTTFYRDLFSSSRDPISPSQLDMIDTRLDASMVAEFTKPYVMEEISLALKEMHPHKSPGPDGLPTFFYKKYWNLVGEEISAVVLKFLNGVSMPEELNHTLVVLIPKVRKPVDMKDLRPISLCNVSYKLISKVLANHLKKILPSIIEENQSAFVSGRLINDNILLSSEVFHFMRHNPAKKRGYMALKLDMSKAYNRIEWDFLCVVMLKMGFPSSWVDRVMICISSVTYSFLINGQPTDPIIPKRRLRQGDPIFPYLFLLCAEGLGGLLNQAHMENRLHGISVCRGAPSITHLFFVDNSIIFARTNLGNAAAIKSILSSYEQLSGQKINGDKSAISFSKGLECGIRSSIYSLLEMEEVQRHDKYLGLPTIFDRSKKILFTGIRDRIWKKLNGWNEKLLSRVGKETLIKAVIHSILSYAILSLKRWSALLGVFGGVRTHPTAFLGKLGHSCVGQRKKEGWVSGILSYLI